MAVGFLRRLIITLPDVDMVGVATGRRHYLFIPLIGSRRKHGLQSLMRRSQCGWTQATQSLDQSRTVKRS